MSQRNVTLIWGGILKQQSIQQGEIKMLGAIIGDIIGSRFEWNNIKTKEFELFTKQSRYTDDSVMTLAIAQALLSSKPDMSDLKENAVRCMQSFGQADPHRGYGTSFSRWLHSKNPQPYNSWGNGAAMRVSPCGLFAKTLEEAEKFANIVTEVTHNHPEGIKGAVVTAGCVFLANNGYTKQEIREYASQFYDLNFQLDDVRDSYEFDESCQGTVPQAIVAFLESTDFEDAIRNAISIGGDSDTIGAITGGIAGAFYGVPDFLADETKTYLPIGYSNIVLQFEKTINNPKPSQNTSEPNLKDNWRKILCTVHNLTTKIRFKDETTKTGADLRFILSLYDINGEIITIHKGPIVTLYEFKPQNEISLNKLRDHLTEIATLLGVSNIEITSVDNEQTIGFEISNKNPEPILFQELIEHDDYYKNDYVLPLILGKMTTGKPVYTDLTKISNLLICREQTLSQSTFLQTLLLSLISKTNMNKCRLLVFDTQSNDLLAFNKVPHLLQPVIQSAKEAVKILNAAVHEMEERYRIFNQAKVHNILEYNQKIIVRRPNLSPLPYLVILIDDIADLKIANPNEFNRSIQMLAQMGVKTGIHLILNTKEILSDFVTQSLKDNFPSRICFGTYSEEASQHILDNTIAAQLLRESDIIFKQAGLPLCQVHTPTLTQAEITQWINAIKEEE